MISEEKQSLRATVRDRIRGLQENERDARSAQIAAILARNLGNAPGVVLGFAPMRLEPRWFGPGMEGWTICLPRVEGDRMEFHRLLHWDELTKGALGAMEPAVSAGTLTILGDIALVPGVVLDRAGRRLGRGGGFYDRFLQDFQGRKIGVCFGCQIEDDVPVEPHDVSVDVIVTEDGWFEARSSAGRPD